MTENCILPQVNNSQYLKNLKVIIQRQVMIAFKITVHFVWLYSVLDVSSEIFAHTSHLYLSVNEVI